jgi:hypothetical protein
MRHVILKKLKIKCWCHGGGIRRDNYAATSLPVF